MTAGPVTHHDQPSVSLKFVISLRSSWWCVTDAIALISRYVFAKGDQRSIASSSLHPPQVVRYGADYLNPGVEATNNGKPAPNAPYASPDSRFPIPDSRLPTINPKVPHRFLEPEVVPD
ncbi:MAG: hypothetical protein F6K56_43595 [Moorea sp. SIO3G5]|nr:hypothetical protein [Moorena sp. SIO3G5]